MFPDEGLERLLGLVESLSDKIAAIDATGFLDASILGESVHPRNFNTLRRIRDEDGSVIEEEEQFTELASNEFLIKQLRELLDGGGREALDALPDGIHSGLARPGARGVFFYFQARPNNGARLHFWKYYDLKNGGIIDNRYLIANLIACDRDTPRVVDPDIFKSVFDLQEKVIANILGSVEEQKARDAAPRSIDPIQQTVATAIQGFLSHPDVDRARAVEVIKFISLPMRKTQVTQLREAFKDFQRRSELQRLIARIEEIRAKFGEPPPIQPRHDKRAACHHIPRRPSPHLLRCDLRLESAATSTSELPTIRTPHPKNGQAVQRKHEGDALPFSPCDLNFPYRLVNDNRSFRSLARADNPTDLRSTESSRPCTEHNDACGHVSKRLASIS